MYSHVSMCINVDEHEYNVIRPTNRMFDYTKVMNCKLSIRLFLEASSCYQYTNSGYLYL